MDREHEIHEERPKFELERYRLQVMLEQSGKALFSNFANGTIFAALLWQPVSHRALAFWLTGVFVINTIRYFWHRNLGRRLDVTTSESELTYIAYSFQASVGLSAATWVTGTTLLVPESLVYQALTAFVFAGITAGAISTYSIVPRIAFTFHLVTLVPFILRLLWDATLWHLGMAGMTLLYLLLTSRTIRELAAHINDALKLQFEKGRLLATMQKQNEALTKANTELNETKHKLMEVVRTATVGEIAATLAHKLNNPMMIVLGRISQLKEMDPRKADVAELSRMMKSIEVAMERIHSTTQSLLAYREPRNPQQAPHVISLRDVVESALQIYDAHFTQGAIKLVADLPVRPVEIHGDLPVVAQVVFTLLRNSHEAIESNGPQQWIRIAGGQDEIDAWIEVSDSGYGIDSFVASHLFEPFFTTKTDSNLHGMGLGLALAKSLIESQHGTIHWCPERKTTTFRITLPKVVDVSAPLAA